MYHWTYTIVCVPLNLCYNVCIIVPTLQCVYHCTYTTVCVPLNLHYSVCTIEPIGRKKWLRAQGTSFVAWSFCLFCWSLSCFSTLKWFINFGEELWRLVITLLHRFTCVIPTKTRFRTFICQWGRRNCWGNPSALPPVFRMLVYFCRVM